MKILLKPVFDYYGDEMLQYNGLNHMNNQAVLENDIMTYLGNIFFEEPDRIFQRLGQTNYYTVDALPGEVIANIKEWFKGYVDNAVSETAFTEMMTVEVEPQDTDPATAEMYLDIMTAPPHPDYHFGDSDGRQEFMDDFDATNNLESVNLDNLNGNGLNFAGVSFRQSQLNDSSFVDAKLQLTNFTGANLERTNFTGAVLRYADFNGANLTGANFSNAELGGVDFSGANLTGANFSGTDLLGVYFVNSNWQEAVNLADNPTFGTAILTANQPLPLQIPLMQQPELEDDEAMPGDKNTCYAVTDLYDKNIDKYLAKDPGNFILVNGKNKECESLVNLQRQYFSAELNGMEGYYECSQSLIDWQNQPWRNERGEFERRPTRTVFNPGDFITDTEYVKVGSANHYIVKPDWFYAGPAPAPRMFKLVATGERKRLISKRIATIYGANVVSDIHCDPLDTFYIFRLEPVFPKTIRRKSTKRKSTKRKSFTKRKSPKHKSRKVLHRRTMGRALTAADETTAGGGTRKKIKKRNIKRRTQKKRPKRN